jgi:hypothetical protein
MLCSVEMPLLPLSSLAGVRDVQAQGRCPNVQMALSVESFLGQAIRATERGFALINMKERLDQFIPVRLQDFMTFCNFCETL